MRTNNDVEGWHHRINANAKGAGLSLYVLIELLWEEARGVMYTCEFVQNGETSRLKRKVYVDLNEKVWKLWGEFNSGVIDANKLLKKCSYLTAAMPIPRRLANE